MDTHDNTPSTAANSGSQANPTRPDTAVPLGRVVTLSELYTHLHVLIQTLGDLRS